jgi:hypothetical protein
MRRAYFPAQQSEIPEQKTSNSKIPRADLTFFHISDGILRRQF